MANPKATKKTQKDLLAVLILSLILGGSGGFFLGAATNDAAVAPTVTSTESQHSHSSVYEVSAKEAPKVELVVTKDAKSGYNIKIIATDFTFTPENVNEDNVLGEGHAHLYVDGEKVGRLYSPYFHYDGNVEGTKKFRVTLNANDHSEYAVDGETIESTQEVVNIPYGDDGLPANNDTHSHEE